MKAAGIKAKTVLYSKDFGRAHMDVQDCVQNAEKFLVQVLNMALKRRIICVSTGTITESQWQLLTYPNKLCYRRSYSEGIPENLHASQLSGRLFSEPWKANVSPQRNAIVICHTKSL